jgi:hypothetical protein
VAAKGSGAFNRVLHISIFTNEVTKAVFFAFLFFIFILYYFAVVEPFGVNMSLVCDKDTLLQQGQGWWRIVDLEENKHSV